MEFPTVDLSKWFVVRLSVTPITRLSRATHSEVFDFLHLAREYGIPREALSKLEGLRIKAYKERERWTIPVRLSEEQLSADFLCPEDQIPIVAYKLEEMKTKYYKELEDIEKKSKEALPQLDKLIQSHSEEVNVLRERIEETANQGRVDEAKNLNERADAEGRMAEKMSYVRKLIEEGKFVDYFNYTYVIKPYGFYSYPIKKLLESETEEKIEAIIEAETQRARKIREEATRDREAERQRIRFELSQLHDNLARKMENEMRNTVVSMQLTLFQRMREALETVIENVKEGKTIRTGSIQSIYETLRPIKMLNQSFNDSSLDRLLRQAEAQLRNLEEKKVLEEQMKAQPIEMQSRLSLIEDEVKEQMRELGETLDTRIKELVEFKSRWQI